MLAITAAVLVAEVVGGVITGSLALLADAGHTFTDVAGLGLAVLAVTFAANSPTAQRTYGYYRLEILAAVVNGMLLFAIAAWTLFEAWQRFAHPGNVEGGLMLAFAAVSLVANLVSLLLLRRGAQASLNVKGAYLEVPTGRPPGTSTRKISIRLEGPTTFVPLRRRPPRACDPWRRTWG